MFKVLAREVIYRRAQEFKIEALRGLQKLFPISSYPFYAGKNKRSSNHNTFDHTGRPVSTIENINTFFFF